uniref:Uncharacterized protein n=1 Tax=Solanum tuberosum TaxID=4113 RepID=M0ZVF9_SOLTU
MWILDIHSKQCRQRLTAPPCMTQHILGTTHMKKKELTVDPITASVARVTFRTSACDISASTQN